jgi:hypothetical protein
MTDLHDGHAIENNDDEDATTKLSLMVSYSVESLVRGGIISPDEAIRAVASALWATVVAYSAPEHFEANSNFAVETFEVCKGAAAEAQKELEFDSQQQGAQWGNA